MMTGESVWIYGIHASSAGDGWASTGADLLGGRGWIVFTERVGHVPCDVQGQCYSPWADAGEAAGIADGSVIELTTQVTLDRAQTLVEQRAIVQAHVTRVIAEKKAEWAEVLRYAGYSEGTVV